MSLTALLALLFLAFAIPVSMVLGIAVRLLKRACNDWVTRTAIDVEWRRMKDVRGRRVS